VVQAFLATSEAIARVLARFIEDQMKRRKLSQVLAFLF
jgi:hypothetical protein